MKRASMVGCLLLFMALAWLWPAVPEAFACSCVPPKPPAEALTESAAVFSGKVVAVSGEGSGPDRTVQLETIRIWKGTKDRNLVLKTAKHEPSCGFPFREGEMYLVYATKDDNGNLRTSLCSRTRLVKEATEDFAALGEGEAFRPEEKRGEPPAPGRGDGRSPGESFEGNGDSWLVWGGAAVVAAAGIGVWSRRKK